MNDGGKHIGLLFGSFNPIHIGHLMLANFMKEFHEMDEVWMVVSPQNPFKNSEILIDGQLRLEMVQIALQGQAGYKSCDIEFRMPVPSYTIHTLRELIKEYPLHQFSMIMGSDNIQSIYKWKDGNEIPELFKIYIYPRLGSELKEKMEHKNLIYTDAPIIEISSTFIREQLQWGKNMEFFLPAGVSTYIQDNNLYK